MKSMSEKFDCEAALNSISNEEWVEIDRPTVEEQKNGKLEWLLTTFYPTFGNPDLEKTKTMIYSMHYYKSFKNSVECSLHPVRHMLRPDILEFIERVMALYKNPPAWVLEYEKQHKAREMEIAKLPYFKRKKAEKQLKHDDAFEDARRYMGDMTYKGLPSLGMFREESSAFYHRTVAAAEKNFPLENPLLREIRLRTFKKTEFYYCPNRVFNDYDVVTGYVCPKCGHQYGHVYRHELPCPCGYVEKYKP